MVVVLLGTLALAIFLAVAPKMPTQGNFLAAILIVIFGFFFVTVSSRITGLIGSSSNPISGMTIATLILTCTIFVALGWTGDMYSPVALCVGAVICIAAAQAGGTSQDLKTGYLVGATPIYQQTGLLIGVVCSAVVIGFTTLYLNKVMGIGSASLAAPQATLMSTIIKGLLSQNLPWGLVLVGVFISIGLELCGIRSLSFAVGSYLPIATTAPIFIGGVVRWLVEKKTGQSSESEISSGTLFSSGLIAGGSIAGILYAVLFGAKFIGAADDGDTPGLIPFLHDGPVGVVAGAIAFTAPGGNEIVRATEPSLRSSTTAPVSRSAATTAPPGPVPPVTPTTFTGSVCLKTAAPLAPSSTTSFPAAYGMPLFPVASPRASGDGSSTSCSMKRSCFGVFCVVVAVISCQSRRFPP
jgi:hypothetical protein